MTGDYHYDAAWERILDMQREAENRRLIAQAYPSAVSVAMRRLAAQTGATLIRAGAALNRWAQPSAWAAELPQEASVPGRQPARTLTEFDEGQPEVA